MVFFFKISIVVCSLTNNVYGILKISIKRLIFRPIEMEGDSYVALDVFFLIQVFSASKIIL